MAETIFSAQFEPASLRILKDPRIALWAGLSVEVWLFEDRVARGLLASRLAKVGARARVCSAYKPLLHYFLERAALSGMRDVIVEYPCHPQAVATRFLSEAYPLAELATQGPPWRWAALEASTELPCYRVTWVDDRGELHFDEVLAPNALRADHLGRTCLVPSGYLRVTDPRSDRILVDEIIETEVEALFRATMVAIGEQTWGRQEPYFERLEIRADVPGTELYRDDGQLISSTLEALHEDLYFSALEFFQHHSGRPPGDRGLQPGQIVPDVRQASPGSPASVCVVLHAARYTGLGDDLEYREHEPWYERAGRMHALAVTGAQLHLSLHGYPAHEWTRPFTGYLPRGFELWSVPKGYFLILRYKPGWKDIAEQFLGELTAELSAMPGLVDFNARQLHSYEAHAGELPFEVRHGIACMVSQNDRQTPGVVLVTEFPDETIAGEAFVFAHEVQTHTVRTAATIWWDLMRRERAAPSQPQTI